MYIRRVHAMVFGSVDAQEREPEDAWTDSQCIALSEVGAALCYRRPNYLTVSPPYVMRVHFPTSQIVE